MSFDSANSFLEIQDSLSYSQPTSILGSAVNFVQFTQDRTGQILR